MWSTRIIIRQLHGEIRIRIQGLYSVAQALALISSPEILRFTFLVRSYLVNYYLSIFSEKLVENIYVSFLFQVARNLKTLPIS